MLAAERDNGPPYVILMDFAGDDIANIRDYRYVPYIVDDAFIIY